MADAILDANHFPTLLAVSNVDGVTPVVLWADPTTHRLLTSAATPTAITVANEATDTSCFILFVTAATGDLGPKTNANLTFNSSTGLLTTGAGITNESGASTSQIRISANNNVAKILSFATANSARWALRVDGDETGSNANSDLSFRRYDDSGVFIDAPLTLDRSTGNAVFTGTVTMPTPFTLGATSVTTTGTQLNYLNAATGTTGTTSTNLVFSTSPTLVTPVLGAATATSINGLTITSSTGTFTLTNAKTLAVTNSLTLSGTDSTTMTFPTTSATIARTDSAQTFTGIQSMTSPDVTTSITTPSTTFSLVNATATTVNFAGAATTMAIGASTALITVGGNIIHSNNAIAASGNAATVPITHRVNTVTNNSAATLTITMTTTSAVDGQLSMVRILDATAAAQTITWVNTENSTVSAPTTSNGSTTLPLTVGFQYNSATSKWRCIASA